MENALTPQQMIEIEPMLKSSKGFMEKLRETLESSFYTYLCNDLLSRKEWLDPFDNEQASIIERDAKRMANFAMDEFNRMLCQVKD